MAYRDHLYYEHGMTGYDAAGRLRYGTSGEVAGDEGGVRGLPRRVGKRVRWRHSCRDVVVERAGVVWELAPPVSGADVVLWVRPDEPLGGDLYHVLAVAWDGARFVSDDDEASPTGALTAGARDEAAKRRGALRRTTGRPA